jgi:hypothetical protein
VVTKQPYMICLNLNNLAKLTNINLLPPYLQ